MSEGTIDELRIEVESDASAAQSSIRALAADVGVLKSALSGGTSDLSAFAKDINALKDAKVSPTVGTQLHAIAEAANSLGSSANNITALAQGLSGLNGLKVSSSIGSQLSKIAAATSGLDTAGMGEAGAAIASIASGVSGLSGVKISSSVANQIRSIAKAIPELNSVDIDTAQFDRLNVALSSLSTIPKSNITSLVNALRKLPEAAAGLHSLDFASFASDCQRLSAALGTLPTKLESVGSGLRALRSASVGSMSGAASEGNALSESLGRIVGIGAGVAGVVASFQQASQAVSYCVTQVNSYIEDMNIFNVALGSYASNAQTYAERVASVMGINVQDWMRNQGVYDTMAQGMGIATDRAKEMSQQLTQLSYDISSYYNISVEDASTKVQAGLAGQLRPLRQLGYDLSDARLKEDALGWGISQNVDTMTQAQKATLRYKEMLSQCTFVQGDMSRTLASPANQLRILQAQFEVTARAVGEAFLPALTAIVPIAIAVMRVIEKLASALAAITGGKVIAGINYSSNKSGTKTSLAGPKAKAAAPAAMGAKAAGPALTAGAPLMSAVSPLMAATAPVLGVAATGGSGETAAVKSLTMSFDQLAISAATAAKKIKEIRDYTLSLDELHVNDPYETASSGSSGGGGSGGGAGGGVGGAGIDTGALDALDLDLPTYDFLGAAQNMTDGILSEMMSGVDKAGTIMQPLVGMFADVCNRIAAQAKGLDIAGAFGGAVLAGLTAFSAFGIQATTILGNILVAFTVPETFTLALATVTQLFLTLSTGIDAAGSFLRGFTNLAVVPAVAWIGSELRGAMVLVIDVAQQWQTWFSNNCDALGRLGGALGQGTSLVLGFAAALATPILNAIAGTVEGISSAVMGLATMLVSLGQATPIVQGLGVVLGAYIVNQAVIAGVSLLGTAFELMGNRVLASSTTATAQAGSLGTALKGTLGEAFANTSAMARTFNSVVSGSRETRQSSVSETATFRTGLASLASNTARAAEAQMGFASHLGTLKAKLAAAKTQVQASTESITSDTRATKANGEGLTLASRLREKYKTATQAAKDAEIAATAATGTSKASLKEQAGLLGTAAAQTVVATGTKGAYTIAQIAANVAETAGAAASSLLAAAMDAIPGMALVSILGALVPLLGNMVSGFVNWLATSTPLAPLFSGINSVLSALGITTSDTASDTQDATDATDANTQAAQEQADQLKQTTSSIEDYAKSHGWLKDAMDANGVRADDLAAKVGGDEDAFDDAAQAADDFATATVNDFGKIDESSQISVDEMVDSLNSNVAATADWSANLQTLMSETGLGAQSNFIKALEEGGPTKYSKTLRDLVADGNEDARAQIVADDKQIGTEGYQSFVAGVNNNGDTSDLTKAMAGLSTAAAKSTTLHDPDFRASGEASGTAYNDGLASTTDAGNKQGQAVQTATVQGMNGGAGYDAAKSAGRNLSGGYFDGITEAANENMGSMAAVRQTIIDSLNGGNGYNEALSAGKNLGGGFCDGIDTVGKRAVNEAASMMRKAVEGFNRGAGYKQANDAGRNMSGGYCDGIESYGSKVHATGSDLADTAVGGLGSRHGAAEDAGRNLGGGFGDGISDTRYTLANVGSDVAQQVVAGLGSKHWGAYDAGRNLAGGFGDGVGSMGLFWVGSDRGQDAVNGMGDHYWGAYDAGKNLDWGMVNGINAQSGAVYWAAHRVGERAVQGSHDGAQEGSPSKATFQQGKWFDMGMINGIDYMADDVATSAGSMAKGAITAANPSASFALRSGALSLGTPAVSVSSSSSQTFTFDQDRLFDTIERAMVSAIEKKSGVFTTELDGVDVGKRIDYAMKKAGEW